MSMVIMHLKVLKEKRNLREDSNLEDRYSFSMLMKKNNQIRVRVKMNSIL